ncbi:diguanylate cyclase [Magnetospirillum molischianum]|uniref:diguanylate cyclase n=1 Tax=Magnetospirillum molischianum DSM 120 TaxID=1150626 RepID=H8FR47_MAGML|nr:diguanylate cyclase [Magnetospirillum molischianum]CCG40835.1 Putative two-component response transcriptional regulator, GGDEF domain [Magnetospirillum molischianum DSM 120]
MARPGRVLLVDNSRTFSMVIAAALTDRLEIEVTIADSLGAAARVLDDETGCDNVVLVISGLVLPDAKESEIVAFFTGRDLPLVVLTGTFDTASRERILSHPVIDYVLKDNPSSIDYVVWLVRRIWRNRDMTALVVDHTPSDRAMLSGLLHLYGFTVLEAEDGTQGLTIAETTPRLDLVVTDYEMPGLDGIQLVRRLRIRHPRDRLAIIGLSSSTGAISAQFIKNGANDYLNKAFQPEELFCRIAQNVENIENIASLHALATTDPLTGLRNRRSFFELAQSRFRTLTQSGRPVAVAMIDVDHFKRINDGWGHDCGDRVLIELARVLAETTLDGDVVGRLGGEEFCLLAADLDETSDFFDSLRRTVAALSPRFGDETLHVTISIGVCVRAGDGRADSLRALLTAADRALYNAKRLGRNRVEYA